MGAFNSKGIWSQKILRSASLVMALQNLVKHGLKNAFIQLFKHCLLENFPLHGG